MHVVVRPREPNDLQSIRGHHTGRWVRYYRCGIGSKPNDAHWSRFVDDLQVAFGDLCAYCEETCKPEVEHFRPTSHYPWLVYRWSNWLLACHDCNNSKRARWPSTGYVDPCANPQMGVPEHYFVFETSNMEIHPNPNLGLESRNKAKRTIDDLGLNRRHHLKKRLKLSTILSIIFDGEPGLAHPRIRSAVTGFTERSAPLSSFARTWLSERGWYAE